MSRLRIVVDTGWTNHFALWDPRAVRRKGSHSPYRLPDGIAGLRHRGRDLTRPLIRLTGESELSPEESNRLLND